MKRALTILLLAILSGAALAEDQRIWASPTYGKVDPREYLPQSVYTSCRFWACINQDPASFATWGVPDGSLSRNNGAQTNANSRPSFFAGATNGNGCLSFDGTDDAYGATGNNFVGNAFSVFAWVKNLGTNRQPFIVCGEATDIFRCYLGTGTGNGYIFATRASLTNTVIVASTNAMSTNVWFFCGGTYNGATARIYLNGVDSGNATGTTTPATNNAVVFGYGANTFAWGAVRFKGLLDAAMIFDRVLTDGEIMAIYNATKGSHP